MSSSADDQGREIWRSLLEAGVVAGLAFLPAALFVDYLTRVAFAETVRQRFANVPLQRVLEIDLLLIGILVATSAVVGSLLARRHGLPGLGTLATLRRSLPLVLPGGIMLGALTYLLIGLPLSRQVPGCYPEDLGWAAVITFKGALFDETVARFCMMTIFCGVVKRPQLANVMQAGFFTFLTTRNMAFYGIPLRWNLISVAGMSGALVGNLAHGWTYARHGLLASATLHMLVDLKFVVHALLAWSADYI